MIHGCGGPPPGCAHRAHHDHRIAMSFLVLGGLARAPVTVAGAETIETSFPGFAALMNRLGAASSRSRHERPGSRVVAVDGPAASGKTTLARLAVHFEPGLPGYRPALPRGRLEHSASGQAVHGHRERAAAAAAVTAADLNRAHAAQRGRQPGRVGRGGDRRCVGRSSPSSASSATAALARCWRAGHRHGGAARRQPQDLRHRQCRGTRRRRCKELQALGVPTIYDDVLAQLQERDARDRSRAIAPLVPASDAFVIDTTDRDIETAFEVARDYVAGPARGTPAAS